MTDSARLLGRSLALASLIFALLLAGCGGEDGGGASGPEGTPKTDALRAEVESAKDDVQKLHRVWENLQKQLPTAEAETGVMTALGLELKGRFTDAYRVVVRNIGNSGNMENMKKLDAWADKALEAERKREGSPLTSVLERETRKLWEYMLAEDKANVALRKKLDYREITLDFDALLEEPYLDSNDVKDIEELRSDLKKIGEEAGGKIWVQSSAKGLNRVEDLLARLEKGKTEHEERMKDPWQQEAMAAFDEVVKHLDKELNSSYTWVPRTFKPYLMIVEKDKSWNETLVAQKRAEALLQLYDVFYNQYGKDLDLKPVEKPIPVIFFRRDGYRAYANKRGMVGAAGHFEPGSGRLFTSSATDIGTIFHEGTHQLSFFNTAGIPFLQKSYWFEEGLAEYLAGNNREVNKETGGWDYEVGLLQKGRLNYWRQNEKKAYSLWDLMDLKYLNREINTGNGDEEKNLMVYSQGWFLCWFMNRFNVDSEGFVVLGKPGKYRAAWMKFFARSLKGQDTRKDMLECLGMADAGPEDPRFKAFEKEFQGYYNWVNRKLALRHDKNNKLLPWDQVIYRGRKIGDREDDELFPPER
jgi:Protein of unknown function (DUF1570)